MRTAGLSVLILTMACSVGAAQTTQPTTRPAQSTVPPDQLLNQMLRPSNEAVRPLQPKTDAPAVDRTSGAGAVAPSAPQLTVMREGTFIVDRTGRLTRGSDGQTLEFTFDSDGQALRDPPVVILPNLKLMAMENAVQGSSRDLRFRITGEVTEYKGRNYVLLHKVVVVPDVQQAF